MDLASTEQLRSAPQVVRTAVARAVKDLPAIERFELVTGVRYGIEERAGKASPPDAHDHETLGSYFFRGRELALEATAAN